MEEVIVIRAQDPDGSVFQAVMDSLNGKRAEVVDVSNLSASVLHIGDLEIHHEQRRVLMAGREVELNHGEYAMLYCMASSPGQVFSKAQLYEAAYCMASSPGQVFSKAQLYEAAWGEAYLHGTNSVENTIWRLRRKLEEDPKHPGYIKTVVGAGYKIDIHNRQSGMED